MEKRIKTFLRRYLLIAIALSLIIFVAGFSFAEFTKSEKAKRVVAAYASTGQMFSSNVLRIGTETPYRKTLFVEKEDVARIDGGDNTVVIKTTVTICNYIQGNPRQFYGKDNAYTLTGTLVTLDSEDEGHERALNSTDYGITINNTPATLEYNTDLQCNEYKWSFSDILTGGSPQEDKYSISIPGAVLRADDKVYLKLKAEPTKYADIQDDIYAYIEIAEKPEAVKAGWDIECTDSEIKDENHFDDYYGYNWRLSGIGTGTVTLTWKPEKVYLSKACLENYKALYPGTITGPVTSENITTMTISVDSDTVNSYDLQFYPVMGVDGKVPGYYDDIKVTCDYAKSNS